MEDIELRRDDGLFLDALGTERIPDPTTAGDFRRRFAETDVRQLLAAIDMGGTLVNTTGECKQGMDISYTEVLGEVPQNSPELPHLPQKW